MGTNGSQRTNVVFGGAGFIGTHLCARLRATQPDATVVAVDCAPPDSPVAGVDYRALDVRAPIPVDLVAADGRRLALYNLAAVHRTPGHPTHEYYETNVLGALNVNEFARQTGAQEIIFTSSIAVYGPDEGRKIETSPPQPTSAYGWSKWLAEEVHRYWYRETPGRRLTIVRPAVIFGPGERGNFTRLATALGRGTFFFPGRRDTIKGCGYVGELVRAMDFVHDRNESEALFNFCYSRDYTIAEICDAFHRVGMLKRPVGTVPLSLMLFAGFGFEVLNSLGLRNSISRERIRKLVVSTNIEPGTLQRMGYDYETDLEEGLRRWQEAVPTGAFV
ncbi:MAG: NAD(P)-dependent oxidoreductase [Geminicoccaceae bacterium]|nr:MAG: NAD(P)-dependent oxidoreductase [Geminicoccaceae bacterium]